VELYESICEDTPLECLILLDISGSMQAKLAQAEKSICELLLSLEGRRGEHLVAVAIFPGSSGQVCQMIRDFASGLNGIRQSISSMKAGGNTPTGPAIRQAISYFEHTMQPNYAEYVV
jgi:Ca-activated chloride channel family protein